MIIFLVHHCIFFSIKKYNFALCPIDKVVPLISLGFWNNRIKYISSSNQCSNCAHNDNYTCPEYNNSKTKFCH